MERQNDSTAKINANILNVVDKLVKQGPQVLQNPATRKMMVKIVEHSIVDLLKESRKNSTNPPGVNDDRAAVGLAVLHTAERALTELNLSEPTIKSLLGTLVRDQLAERKLRQEKAETFLAENGQYPPSFLVISPSKACNLHCSGCYPDSGAFSPSLEWELVDRVITEAKTFWGVNFILFSGGEPMAYTSQGKTILNLAEKHPDVFFIMLTNGTLITDETARRLARLGNLMPSISVDGWNNRTDARRGEGIFNTVMESMDRLYQAGVPFGVSLTATRLNAEEILSEEFIDFLFMEKHALYGWFFQYMPVGRSFTLDLMPTPQQRLWMWRQSLELIRKKQIFLADFWNHGTLANGCISAGGSGRGGYFYIDWNGAVSPCIFVPYSPVNIRQVYARGGSLNDIWKEPFFESIRSWQKTGTNKNRMAPCLIRDHHDILRGFMEEHAPEPCDQNALAALLDSDYGAGLDQYARDFQSLSDPVWEEYYLKPRDGESGRLAELPVINNNTADFTPGGTRDNQSSKEYRASQ